MLDSLHAITSKRLNLNVLVASLHGSAPKGWWEEWIRQTPYKLPVDYMLARMSLAPHTGTETLQMLEPIGADRWGYELALKYGIRDMFRCPVGGRWLVVFWSPRPLGKEFTEGARIMIFAAASFAVLRLDQLAPPAPASPEHIVTPRELAVLRPVSVGMLFKEVAEYLEIGEETVRTHLKKVQLKLGGAKSNACRG